MCCGCYPNIREFATVRCLLPPCTSLIAERGVFLFQFQPFNILLPFQACSIYHQDFSHQIIRFFHSILNSYRFRQLSCSKFHYKNINHIIQLHSDSHVITDGPMLLIQGSLGGELVSTHSYPVPLASWRSFHLL